jgi:hypothetical protein
VHVAATSGATLGDQQALAVLIEITEQLAGGSIGAPSRGFL